VRVSTSWASRRLYAANGFDKGYFLQIMSAKGVGQKATESYNYIEGPTGVNTKKLDTICIIFCSCLMLEQQMIARDVVEVECKGCQIERRSFRPKSRDIYF